MRSFNWKAGLTFALALAASAGVSQQAFAQFFFRPFAYSYRYQLPDQETPGFASRPAVASILGRVGYRLVGPLGRRGDQIVATGVSRRDGEMRFIVDPYEGRILRAVRLGPPPMYSRDGPPGGDSYPPSGRGAPYAPPAGAGPYPGAAGTGPVGPGPAGRDFDNDPSPDADDDEMAPGAPGPMGAAPDYNRRSRAAQKAGVPSSGANPTTKPLAVSPTQTLAAPPAPAPGAAASTEPKPVIPATPQATGATAQSASKPFSSTPDAPTPAKRAQTSGGSSRRAIVPPPGAKSATVVAPAASGPAASTPTDSATAKTPETSAAKPAGG